MGKKIKRSGLRSRKKPKIETIKKKRPKPRRAKVKQKSSSGLSIRKMSTTTPKFLHINSDDVNVLKVRKVIDKTTMLPAVKAVTQTQPNQYRRRPPKYDTVIHLMEDDPDIRITDKKTKVKVSCSCDFFTYYCEVPLYMRGAADILYSNGDYPHVTNPRAIPIVCKHLLSLFKRAKQRRF